MWMNHQQSVRKVHVWGSVSDTIEYLRRLSRKERLHILRVALACATYRLDDHLRAARQARLGAVLRDEVSIPPDAFVAMEYHLDWIHMAI